MNASAQPVFPISRIIGFAPEALDIMSSAFVGEFTPETLAAHPRWKRFVDLLDVLELAEFPNRTWYDLFRDEVITDAEYDALAKEGEFGKPRRGRPSSLRREVIARATLDEAQQFLTHLGDSDWHNHVENVLVGWRRLAAATKAAGGNLNGYTTEGGGTCWTRTWHGNFIAPSGKSYDTLNLVETSLAPGGANEVTPEIAKVTRLLRRDQKQTSLTISVMRDAGAQSTLWPHEQWATAGVRRDMVKPISFDDVFSILNNAQFQGSAGPLCIPIGC